MDPKSTWPVVKFLIASTGFRRREARMLLEQISSEKYSRLFIEATAWDRDAERRASETLRALLGDDRVPALEDATAHASKPSTAEDEETEEPAPRRKKSRR